MKSPVAYLGPAGTFSHLVALRRFRNDSGLVPRPGLDAVFQFVMECKTHRAIVPVENSSGGTIYDTVDLLIENAGTLFITEEIILDVRIALLGRKGKPIRRIFSHFAQIRHHREWIRSKFPNAEIIPVASTAVAAERTAAEPGTAALSAPGAAAIYDLDILVNPVIRKIKNQTDFVLLGHHPGIPSDPSNARSAVAVSFGNTSGSLYKFLEPFARHGVNINRIVSRPFPGDPSRCLFFLQIDGASGARTYDLAMKSAAKRADTFYDFGSYRTGRRVKS